MMIPDVRSIIMDPDDNILVVCRSANRNNYPNYWEFPWWWPEAQTDNNPIDTLLREVREETWLCLSSKTTQYFNRVIVPWNKPSDFLMSTLFISRVENALSDRISLCQEETSWFKCISIQALLISEKITPITKAASMYLLRDFS